MPSPPPPAANADAAAAGRRSHQVRSKGTTTVILTEHLGSSPDAEVYRDKRSGMVAKVAFTAKQIFRLRREAKFYERHLVDFPVTPRYYGLFELGRLGVLLLEDVGMRGKGAGCL